LGWHETNTYHSEAQTIIVEYTIRQQG